MKKEIKPNWMMEFKFANGSKSWEYFYSDKDFPIEEGIKVANDYMEKRKNATPTYSFLPRPPIKFPSKVLVRQYDNVKKCAVKGGLRFVLSRSGFTIKTNLRTIKEEYYIHNSD